MNILYKDISSSPVPFRPQYAGDLLYKYSSQSPLSTPPILAFSNTPGLDLSGAVYNIPIHWRAKCIIPQPSTMTSGINWNGFGDSKFDPTEKSKIYCLARQKLDNSSFTQKISQQNKIDFKYSKILKKFFDKINYLCIDIKNPNSKNLFSLQKKVDKRSCKTFLSGYCS